jgi:hypothetical protein
MTDQASYIVFLYFSMVEISFFSARRSASGVLSSTQKFNIYFEVLQHLQFLTVSSKIGN